MPQEKGNPLCNLTGLLLSVLPRTTPFLHIVPESRCIKANLTNSSTKKKQTNNNKKHKKAQDLDIECTWHNRWCHGVAQPWRRGGCLHLLHRHRIGGLLAWLPRSEHKYRNLKLDHCNCCSHSPSLYCKLFENRTFEFPTSIIVPDAWC